MLYFFNELKKRNPLLYFMGWLHFTAAIICIVAMQFDSTEILGIDRWIKPMKFFLSVSIMLWTMGWLMNFLHNKKKVRTFSWIIALAMLVENSIITIQSFRNTTSHFNNTSPLNSFLFAFMGLIILLFTVTAVLIAIEFFRQKNFDISPAYLLSIRAGLILFIIFTSEGGAMLANRGHTVGAADGGAGLPLINWSTLNGDLRVAHFFGMHALQIIPLFGFYIAKSKKQVWIISIAYFILVSLLLAEALIGKPFLHV